MTVLIINEGIKALVQEAVAKARAQPVSLEKLEALAIEPSKEGVLSLEDKGGKHERTEAVRLLIPMGYLCSISFEQQPVGLVRHLSVSVERPGFMPNPPVVKEIATLFGFRMIPGDCHSWLEEFDPGHHAINVIERVEDVVGHA